jgi:hypothetical protein
MKRRGKAAAVVALDLPFAGALDVKRLAGPQLAPPLAGRMSDDRPRPGIEPRIPRLVPRVNAGQAEVCSARLNE